MPNVGIPLPFPFSFDAVVRSHGWYDLPPFSYDRDRGVLKTMAPGLARAAKGASELTFWTEGRRLLAHGRGLSSEKLRQVTIRVFSLDADLSGFSPTTEHAALAQAISRGGGRMLRAPTLFEDAVKMLLTTNCSWEATRGMVARLISEAGAEGLAFPPAEAIADLSLRRLRERVRCGYRAQALRLFARRVATGRLRLSAWEEPTRPAADVRQEILAERGFGPYAAEGLLRILGRHDFLALDSWIRQKYRRLHPGRSGSTDRSIARRYARFGRYRGLALWLELTGDWHEAQSGGEMRPDRNT